MKKYIMQFKRQFIFAICLLTLAQSLTVYASVINANILNALIKRQVIQFVQQVGILLCIWCTVALIQYVSEVFEQHLIQNLDIAIRTDIVTVLTAEPYNIYNRRDSATYESWLNNDLQLINQQGFESLFIVIEDIAGALLALVTLVYFHWLLASAAAVLTGLIILLPRLLDHRLSVTSTGLTHQNEQFVSTTHDALHAFNLLYTFQSLPLLIAKVRSASVTLKYANVKRTVVQTQIGIIGFLGNILSQVVLIGLAGLLAVQHLVSIGTINAVGSLAGNVFNSLGNLSNTLGLIRGTRPIFQKYVDEQAFMAVPSIKPGNAQKDVPLVLQLNNVSYHYPASSILLVDHVSQTFYQGQKILLTGASGTGKSTFLKLIAGYLPLTEGTIMISRHQISAKSANYVLRKVLYLDQQPLLIQGTVRENLRLNQTFTDQQLIHQLLQMKLVTSEKDGTHFLNLQVGTDGNCLSGGQRQRLALARALLRQPEVLLVDEGTSAIDPATAIYIEKLLLNMPALTLIMISHTVHDQVLPLFSRVIDFANLTRTQDTQNN